MIPPLVLRLANSLQAATVDNALPGGKKGLAR